MDLRTAHWSLCFLWQAWATDSFGRSRGNPLHECLWEQKPTGALSLVSARLRLDWGQWVGIKPEGLVNTITLDLSRRPGWEQITQDDLRQMAARSLHSDLAMVRFFYRDEDVVLHGNGQATIHQVKDAFYVLPNGSFEEARFMSCMSRMEWSQIDYLPVVELFLSLLPGTGSATFELIRSLYDDQNSNGGRALQYRGIPAYPSEAAFRLFSLFFTPSVASRQSPLEVFLDIERSHEVHWLPASGFPVRYMDEEQHICVTVRNQMIQKVTWWDDPSGLSFNRIPESGLPVSDNRGAGITADGLWLFDGPGQKELTIRPCWQLSQPNHPVSWKPLAFSWRDGFPMKPPLLTPQEAFSSVLLYPDKSEMIGEKESQPFAFDFLMIFLKCTRIFFTYDHMPNESYFRIAKRDWVHAFSFRKIKFIPFGTPGHNLLKSMPNLFGIGFLGWIGWRGFQIFNLSPLSCSC